MRILICGSRDWFDFDLIKSKLSNCPPDTVVIHGGCRGADSIAGDVAVELGFEVRCFPADWKAHGRAAGPVRNQRMLEEGKPDRVIAFHDDIKSSRGTIDMIRRAEKVGVMVEIVSRKLSQ